MASIAQERAGLLTILGLADTGQSQAELLQRLSDGTNVGEKAEQTHLDLMGAIASPSVAGVITPANAAYTQADQTALANAVLSIATAVNALKSAAGTFTN